MKTLCSDIREIYDSLQFRNEGVDLWELDGYRFNLRRQGERYVMLSMREGDRRRDLYGALYTGYTEELVEWSRKRVLELERESRMMELLGYRGVSPVEWRREYGGGYVRVLRNRYYVEFERFRGAVGDMDVYLEERRYYRSSRRVWRCTVEFEREWSTLEGLQGMSQILRECMVSSKCLKRLELEAR